MNQTEYYVTPGDIGIRIDKFLFNFDIGLTRSSIQKLIDNKSILVNSSAVSKNYKLKENDLITINFPEPVKLDVLTAKYPYRYNIRR